MPSGRSHESSHATLDVKARRAFEVEFDWKIGIEAFIESLHVPTIHGRSLYPFVDVKGTVCTEFGDHSGMRVPFRMENAHERDGLLGAAAYEAGVEMFPGLDEEQRRHHYAYLTFPSTILLVSPNDAMLLSMLPLDAGRSHIRVEVLGTPAANETQAAYYDSLEPAYDRLLDEDLDNLPWIQKGLASGSLSAITIGALEERIVHFHSTLEAKLGRRIR
jgi:phenylpropionate dioxygenase-like ring-hydroxylating dioxygenase large terminal subunit